MEHILLIKGASVFAPAALGIKDVLIAGNRIAAIGDNLAVNNSTLPIRVIDGSGKYLVPGFVDSLVHYIGGGGEGGFATRTPEMQLTDATLAGVTTAIGVLGTDATTRTLTNLLAKAHALETEGISTYCHTGSYEIPCRTLTGTITDDLILIDKMIGVGEIAISDHRSSQPTITELRKVAAAARIGGMLAGKGGTVSVHVGSGHSLLQPLIDAVQQTELTLRQFYPTHINRNEALFNAGLAFAQAGGVIDFTTSTTAYDLANGEIAAAVALQRALAAGIPATQLTMSSDGNASLPIYSSTGTLIGLEVGKVASLFNAFQTAVLVLHVSLPDALTAVTLAPAQILGLKQKGELAVGKDADMLLLNSNDLSLDTTIAKGRCLVRNGQAVVWGTFEQPQYCATGG